MPVAHERIEQDRKDHERRVGSFEDQNEYHKDEAAQQRAERDPLPEKKRNHSRNRHAEASQRENHPGKRQKRRGALSALEIRENRKAMADHGERAGDISSQRAHERASDQDGNHHLQHVAQKRQRARRGPVNPQHVGRPGVMASEMADVLPVLKLADDDSRLEIPETVSDHGTDQRD